MFAIALLSAALLAAAAETPLYEAEMIFDPEVEELGHVHASCIVECPNGDLRAVWYQNGPSLPPPYYAAQGDKSADVHIGGSRKAKGAEVWEKPFVMARTFGASDNNPCMVIDAEARLWLVYATLLAVPERSWGSALVRYHWASDYDHPGVPNWDSANILPVHPAGFEEAYKAIIDKRGDARGWSQSQREKGLGRHLDKLKDTFRRRLGWMPRVHPLVRSDGAVIVPLSNENYTIPAMAITSDAGETWTISKAVPFIGLIQPSLVELAPMHIAAFFRDGTLANRIMRSDSHDGGLSWGEVSPTSLPNPGAGIEALLLDNGHLLMIYNDMESDPRDSLAVSISADAGKTWEWTRHLEDTDGQRFDYPSIVQAKDGSLHATYSYNTKAIKYVHFNEAWVQQGD